MGERDREGALCVIEKALSQGRKALSEAEAKHVLAAYHIPVTREMLIRQRCDVATMARQIGYPVVMKGCSDRIAHKTERGLVRLDIRDGNEALKVFDEILNDMNDQSGGVLIQELVLGRRELVMGMTRDDQFGPCVMFGLGGIFTEILKDVSFRRAPLRKDEALAMMREIRGCRILDAVRGMEAADRESLADMILRVGQIGLDIPQVREIDLNPVMLVGKDPVAVDALIMLD